MIGMNTRTQAKKGNEMLYIGVVNLIILVYACQNLNQVVDLG